MVAQTYVDAVGAVRAWINGRTATLVGLGHPLQKGAHFKRLDGAADATYARLSEGISVRGAGAENPDMDASLLAEVYGGTREEATAAAVALAEELSTVLCGTAASVPGAVLFVVDDITGPLWAPDGDLPRLTLTFTVRVRPA
jgi:hypothetical protein